MESSASQTADVSQPPPRRLRRRPAYGFLSAAVGVLLGLLILEIGCQLYAFRIEQHYAAVRALPDYYYAPSGNDTLVYELAPGFDLLNETGRLHINRHGIRDDSDRLFRELRRVAVLGDSVVFGVGHSQEHTLSALLQQELDPETARLKTLNFAVPGYSLAEIAEFLRVKNALYDVDEAVFLLNLNDFAPRDTMYEGADNGLYRMHRPPLLKSPYFIGKAVYRVMKNGSLTGAEEPLPRWYRWMFKGNREWGCAILAEMARYAAAEGIRFSVALLPAGCAYSDNGRYELRPIHNEIASFLSGQDIRFHDLAPALALAPAQYLDAGDHPTREGNYVIAREMAKLVRAPEPIPGRP